MKIELGVISKEARELLDNAHKEASASNMIVYAIEHMMKYNQYGLDCIYKIKNRKFRVIIEEDLEGDK